MASTGGVCQTEGPGPASLTKEAGVSETVDEENPAPVKMINNTANSSVITTLLRS